MRVELEYDLATSALKMRSRAPTVMVLGILAQAHSMVTQNQVMQRLQALAAKPPEKKIEVVGSEAMPS